MTTDSKPPAKSRWNPKFARALFLSIFAHWLIYWQISTTSFGLRYFYPLAGAVLLIDIVIASYLGLKQHDRAAAVGVILGPVIAVAVTFTILMIVVIALGD